MHKQAHSSLWTKAVATITAGVIFAVPVFARTANDSYINELWHLKKIRAFEAWNSSLGFEGITIAIIDSGVDTNHPDLKDNIWRNQNEIAGNGIDDDRNGYVDDIHGWDFVDDDNDPRPNASGSFDILGVNHGTIDAGIASARGDNGKGISGVAWQTTIMPIRVLGSDGLGAPLNVVRAVEYAVHNGARIINLSFSGPVNDPVLAIALRRAYDAGVFIVAAAGNAPNGQSAIDLDKNPLYPACLDIEGAENIIYGVAATDADDKLASFSNYGAGCVDLSAPGSRMLSTQYYVPGNKDFNTAYGGYYNGTSLAAAVVSGVVSLMYAVDRNLTPRQIMNILTETSIDISEKNPGLFGKMGRGRIDAAAAVRRVIESRRRTPSEPLTTTSALTAASSDARVVVAAPTSGRKAEVRMFSADGSYIRSFMAFPDGFTGGVTLATADFDKTAKRTIIVGAGPGGAPQVRVFDINTQVLGSFLAYGQSFRGGIVVAGADVDGNGRDEIVTSAGKGGGPHVRIFTPAGVPIGGFFAFNPSHRLGALIVADDIDGDGKDEIIAAEPGGTEVRIFDGQGKRLATMSVVSVRAIALADVDGDGKKEIVVRSGARTVVATAYRPNGSKVAVFDPTTFVDSIVAKKTLRIPGLVFGSFAGTAPTIVAGIATGAPSGFTAFESSFRGGVSAVLTE